jgi:hypothetical protein
MGVLYIIMPLTQEVADDVRRQGVHVPRANIAVRNPTVREIRAVCNALPGVVSRLHTSPDGDRMYWDLRGPDGTGNRDTWTEMSVSGFTGDDDEPVSVAFEKGWPSLILVVTHGLAATCGPLVVYPDTGDPPVVVEPSSVVQQLLATWPFTVGGTY